MFRKTLIILAMLFAILGSGAEAWGQTTASVELCTSWEQTLAYATAYTYDYTIDDLNGSTTTMTLGVKGVYRQSAANTYFQMNKKSGYFKNTTKLPGKITKIETTWSVAKGPTKCYFATNAEASSSNTTVTVTAETSVTYTPPTGADYYFFNIDVSTGSGSAQMTSCKVYYEGSGGDNPSITVNPSTITWDDSPINEELSETISVSQANLTEGITISSTIGTVAPSTIAAGEDATNVTFTYTPTSVGDFEGEIIFTSGETTATVSVTGSAYDPSQVDTYELFTGDLVEGDYVIYYSDKAMKNTVTSNRLDYSEVSPENNVITNPDAAIVWHIAPSGDYWTIFNAAVAKYAAGNGTKNQATLLTDGTDNGSLWTVSGTETHDFTNKKNTSNSVNATLRNNGTYGFACYATSTGGALTLYKKAENKAATPTLTDSQTFSTKPFEVTITNNENGATVYYTTDGNDPTTETTTNFTGESKTIKINTTTTVKAMAVVEGKANSEIASATYTEQKNDPENQWSAEAYTATIGGENTFPIFSTQSDGAVTYTSSNTNAATIDATTGNITLVAAGTTTITASTTETATYMAGEASYTLTVKEAPLATMDAIFAKATAVGTTATNVEVTFNNWVISGVKNNNAYLTDNNGEGLIIYTSNHGFEVDNILSGTVTCKLQLYNGSAELTNLTTGTSGLTVTTGGSITPVEASIAALGGVNTGAVITVNNVECTGIDSFSDGENTIKAYNAFMTLPSFTNGDSYNLTGVYIQYNTTKEIAPRSAADIQLIVAAPTFTPEGGDYNAAQTVEITSATTGATIYYTLDKSNPTTGSTPYTDPIEISENTTIKAIAVKNGVSSEIATAVYNITITTVATPTFEPEDGSYFDESLKVSLDCATDGATIVYTTDNWSTQTPYSDPFTITETTTVKAKATKDAMDESEIAKATFTKRYKVNYVVNGDGSLIEPTYVTPSSAIGTLPTPEAANIPTGFDFAGWTESESDIQFVANPYTPTSDVTLYAVFSREVPSPSTEEAVTIIDGSKLTSTATTTNTYQTFDEHVITFSKGAKKQAVQSGAENYFTKDEAILIGKKDTYIYNTTPFDKITKFEVYANKGASTKVSVGINFSTSAISSYSETADNTWTETLSTVDHVYDASAKLPTGAKYFWYQVTNDNNSQVQFKITYQKPTTTTEYYIRVFEEEESEIDDLTVEAPMIIMGGYTLTVANNLTIANNSAALTIEKDAIVIVEGTLTNNGAFDNLVIEDGGQLVFNNSDVKATVEKVMDKHGYWGKNENPKAGWYFLAAPMEDFTVASFIEQAGAGNYDLYRYYVLDGTPIWYNYKANTSDFEHNFVSGRGYLAAYQTTNLLKMQGTLNAGTEFNFTSELNGEGHFTLLGNPFTYDLKWSDFNNKTGIYNGFAVVDSEDGIIKYAVGDTPIKVGTGFMVYTNGDNTKLSFTKGSGSGKSNDILALNLFASNGNGEDNTIIVIDDNNGGFAKADNFNTNVPQIYTEKLQTKYGIRNFSTNTKEFFVSFKAVGKGSNTIRLETIGKFDYVHLYDKLLDVDVDMLLEGSYTFEASEDDDTHRFIVRIDKGNTGIDENETENFVNVYNGEIHVSGSGEVQIFDVMGRIMHSEVISGDATISTGGFKGGVYVVRLIGNGWTKTEKIVVRR
ncbi:MAG: chitobiase/beta-hexosaminidase C-terminal domain-containing protein [Bacteroidales bacterium]|nr:chitobiase/beta-hexosaminidase C-terminal domain-containing protein [Bacteroidales bacterium]